MSVGTKGVGRGEFSGPWGVVVEQRSGNIYVADQSNNRVEVFNGEAEYLSEFGSDKMKSPLCIAIYKDRVFVTQYGGGCLLVYDLNGQFIKQVGTPGSKEGQFANPYGIAIITLMEISTCVTILTTEYKYSQMTIPTDHNSVRVYSNVQ